MIYQEKVKFDNWYQLEWNDVEFRKVDTFIIKCINIEEVKQIFTSKYPNSNLKVSLLTDYKSKNEVIKKGRNSKNNKR